jgi:P27 family predicted phage terminase small subunit
MPMPRKTIPEHELAGTRAEYALPDADVVAGRPKYPRNLSPDAKRVFKRLCRLLEKRRNLTEGDSELLRLYALAYDRHARAIEKLAVEGEVRTYSRLDKHNEQVTFEEQNLWLKITQDSEKFMRGCLADLGLNPLNRNKVKQTEKPAAPDPDAHLLSREAPQPPVEEEVQLPDETRVVM